MVLTDRLKTTEPVTSAAAVSKVTPVTSAAVCSNAPRLPASPLDKLSSTAAFTSAISSTLVKSTASATAPTSAFFATVATITFVNERMATAAAWA